MSFGRPHFVRHFIEHPQPCLCSIQTASQKSSGNFSTTQQSLVRLFELIESKLPTPTCLQRVEQNHWSNVDVSSHRQNSESVL